MPPCATQCESDYHFRENAVPRGVKPLYQVQVPGALIQLPRHCVQIPGLIFLILHLDLSLHPARWELFQHQQ